MSNKKVLKLVDGDYRLDEDSPSFESAKLALKEMSIFMETLYLTDGVRLTAHELVELIESENIAGDLEEVELFNSISGMNYTPEYYQEVKDAQRAKGIRKYGIPIEENTDDRDWGREALEEYVDMLAYIGKANG